MSCHGISGLNWTIAVDLDDDDTLVVSRTTTLPVRNIKAFRVATAE